MGFVKKQARDLAKPSSGQQNDAFCQMSYLLGSFEDRAWQALSTKVQSDDWSKNSKRIKDKRKIFLIYKKYDLNQKGILKKQHLDEIEVQILLI